MHYNNIITRINLAINNLDKVNFISSFENIINDLEYIFFDLDTDKNKMSDVEQFEYGTNIEEKLMEYFSKLAKYYMQINYNKNVNIVQVKVFKSFVKN